MLSEQVKFETNPSGVRKYVRPLVSQELLISTKFMLRTYLNEVTSNLLNGRGQDYFEIHGVDVELAALLFNLSAKDIDELLESYARKLFAINDGKIVLTIDFAEMLKMIDYKHADTQMQIEYLKAQASNQLMEQYFGMRAPECKMLRAKYGIAASPGRKTKPKGEAVRDQVLNVYEAEMQRSRCPKTSLIKTHRTTHQSVDFIHHVINDYAKLAL